jgi:DNA-binding PadR family transcriptional regulator
MAGKKGIEIAPRILSLIAEHVEYEQFKMAKALGITYPTLLKYLAKLKKGKYISWRFEQSEKGGKDKNIYRLTWLGLHYALCNTKDPKKLESIINHYPDKALIFNKWPLFKEAKLDGFMLDSLRLTLEDLVISSRRFQSRFSEKEWRELVDYGAILSLLFAVCVDAQFELGIETILKDPELNNLVENAFSKKEEEYKQLHNVKAKWNKAKEASS